MGSGKSVMVLRNYKTTANRGTTSGHKGEVEKTSLRRILLLLYSFPILFIFGPWALCILNALGKSPAVKDLQLVCRICGILQLWLTV